MNILFYIFKIKLSISINTYFSARGQNKWILNLFYYYFFYSVNVLVNDSYGHSTLSGSQIYLNMVTTLFSYKQFNTGLI